MLLGWTEWFRWHERVSATLIFTSATCHPKVHNCLDSWDLPLFSIEKLHLENDLQEFLEIAYPQQSWIFHASLSYVSVSIWHQVQKLNQSIPPWICEVLPQLYWGNCVRCMIHFNCNEQPQLALQHVLDCVRNHEDLANPRHLWLQELSRDRQNFCIINVFRRLIPHAANWNSL